MTSMRVRGEIIEMSVSRIEKEEHSFAVIFQCGFVVWGPLSFSRRSVRKVLFVVMDIGFESWSHNHHYFLLFHPS